MLGGLVVLAATLVIVVYVWIGTNPGTTSTAAGNPDLTPLKIDQISPDDINSISTLTKFGNVPVANTPAELGRPDPFAGL